MRQEVEDPSAADLRRATRRAPFFEALCQLFEVDASTEALDAELAKRLGLTEELVRGLRNGSRSLSFHSFVSMREALAQDEVAKRATRLGLSEQLALIRLIGGSKPGHTLWRWQLAEKRCVFFRRLALVLGIKVEPWNRLEAELAKRLVIKQRLLSEVRLGNSHFGRRNRDRIVAALEPERVRQRILDLGFYPLDPNVLLWPQMGRKYEESERWKQATLAESFLKDLAQVLGFSGSSLKELDAFLAPYLGLKVSTVSTLRCGGTFLSISRVEKLQRLLQQKELSMRAAQLKLVLSPLVLAGNQALRIVRRRKNSSALARQKTMMQLARDLGFKGTTRQERQAFMASMLFVSEGLIAAVEEGRVNLGRDPVIRLQKLLVGCGKNPEVALVFASPQALKVIASGRWAVANERTERLRACAKLLGAEPKCTLGELDRLIGGETNYKPSTICCYRKGDMTSKQIDKAIDRLLANAKAQQRRQGTMPVGSVEGVSLHA